MAKCVNQTCKANVLSAWQYCTVIASPDGDKCLNFWAVINEKEVTMEEQDFTVEVTEDGKLGEVTPTPATVVSAFDALIEESLLTDQGSEMLHGHKEEQFDKIKKAFLNKPDTMDFIDIVKEIKDSETRFKEVRFKGLETFAKKASGVWHERQFAVPEGDYNVFKEQLKGLAVTGANGAPKLKTTAKHGSSVMVYAVPNSWYSSRSSICNAEDNGVPWAQYNKTELEIKNKEYKASLKPTKTAGEQCSTSMKGFFKKYDACNAIEQEQIITEFIKECTDRLISINNVSEVCQAVR